MSHRKSQLSKNLTDIHLKIDAAAQRASRNPSEIKLIVVTKTFPVSDIEILYELGVRDFGENRDQEGSVKAPLLPSDAIWHFQGQIQSNKLKSIGNWADVVHSLDDLRHAKILGSQVSNKEVFIQVSLDAPGTENRGGVGIADLSDFIFQMQEFSNLNVLGLMAVAPIGQSPELAFERLRKVAGEYPQFSAISAGMSGDFEAAISQGATHLRIGSQILGLR